jgi:site-specific recombinase XerC
MAEDEVVAFVRVIDALRDRTMFLRMRRCGLRVGEVRRLPWSAIDRRQGTVRIENRTGPVDRVVYLSSGVVNPLRQWHRRQAAEARDVFPRRLTRKGGPPLSARQIRNRMSRDLTIAGIAKADAPHSLRQSLGHPAPQRGRLAGGR